MALGCIDPIYIHVLVIPKFGGTVDLVKVAVHWAAMTTPSSQYNTIMIFW